MAGSGRAARSGPGADPGRAGRPRLDEPADPHRPPHHGWPVSRRVHLAQQRLRPGRSAALLVGAGPTASSPRPSGRHRMAGRLPRVRRRRRARRPRRAGRLAACGEVGATLARTARSRLPGAIEHVLRSPIVTAHTLAGSLSVTPQAALGLLRQLIAAGVVREATGRAAGRAFTTV
jgi:hypothetical protein